ncbi:MAG: aldehyde ferredoxin oxidoreductase family protein [Myxococcota bacterium]|jgi:aldehyde:ferredoxin oxidoreductase
MKGNWNKIARINLGTGARDEFGLDEGIWRDFIGGSGVGAWIFKEHYLNRKDENPLIVMAGPITGTTFPGSSRFAVCTRSPLTGIWGEGTCGGNWGPMLKNCGIDGLVIEGKAEKPVYLMIENNSIKVLDAADLWGKDTYDTIDMLEERHPKARVLTIGPAGENGVKFANICNDKGDFIGRTGMGCVMGGKNLKALVVLGNTKTTVADQEKYNELRKKVLEQIKNSTPALSLHDMGTDASMDLGMMTGDIPIRGWSIGEDFEMSSNLGGPTLTEKFLVKRSACLYCPIACRRVMKVDGGPYAMEEGPGPEYETCCSLGSNLHNPDAAAMIKGNETANRLGMDTITLGNTISFAIDCFENGLLDPAQNGGVALKYNDMAPVLDMIRKIAYREGLGDMLAEGSRAAAAKIGRGADQYAVHVKGLELPMHDPHGWTGMGLAYMMSTRGACHLQHLVHPIEQGMVFYEGIGLPEDFDGQKSEGKGLMVKVAEDLGVPSNAMVICQFVGWCMVAADFPALLSAVTGFDYDVPKYLKAGARIWLLKRSMNNIWGVTAADDTLPPKILKPYKEGGAAGNVPNVELLRSDYYAARGMAPDGRPLPETLAAAGGLDDMKKLLYG